jgi:peptidoglycan/xylan/chitin deacetylase (PgdA/CDA1 family)
MSFKHTAKLQLKELYARTLYHTGLHRLVDRLMPRRMLILFGHCIEDDAVNGFLPADMKLREDTFRRLAGLFGKRYDLVTIGEGWRRLQQERAGRSLVAFSFDDGYRDNVTRLLPLLEETGARATVFLETLPLAGERVNWSHKFHWVIRPDAGGDVEGLVRRYLTLSEDPAALEALRRALEEGGERLAYRAKRVLKYEAEAKDRDRTLNRIFQEAGGDEAALCRAMYLSWEDARRLAAGPVELGGHTVHHAILSRLDESNCREELSACAGDLRRELGAEALHTFAYPFGRRWDYHDAAIAAVEAEGFQCAVNTHAGTVGKDSPRWELKRLPIDDQSKPHLLVTEACGGFDLLRRFGLDLSE